MTTTELYQTGFSVQEISSANDLSGESAIIGALKMIALFGTMFAVLKSIELLFPDRISKEPMIVEPSKGSDSRDDSWLEEAKAAPFFSSLEEQNYEVQLWLERETQIAEDTKKELHNSLS